MKQTFLTVVLLLALSALIGCSGESGPTLVYPFPIPTDLRLSGIVDLADVAIHQDLGGVTPSIIDMRPFAVSIQDDLSAPVNADEQGRFVLTPISIRDQVVIFCRHATHRGLILEWMAASSAGLYGNVNVTIDIRSTARSMIARCLREKYGRRIRPEELKTEHISTTVDAIAEVLEKFPGKLAAQNLDQVSEVKAAYTAVASSLHLGNSGAYPNTHVLMLHMAGDNSLSSYLAANIEDIARVGLPSGTQIIIQADFPVDGMKRLMISGNKVVELAAIGSYDSSSGAVIADFIAWTRRAFPAKYYSLIISSHADAWKSAAAQRGSLIVDDSAETIGNPQEIAAYIAGAAKVFDGSDRPLELLVFDACSMATVEIAWQFRKCAGYQIFSQAFVPAAGLPYGKIMAAIRATGIEKLNSEALGRLICDQYRLKYIDGLISLPVTISMIRNAGLETFMNRLNAYLNRIYAERDVYATVLASLRDSLEVVTEEGSKKYVVQAFEKAEYRDLKSLVFHATNPLTTVKFETENLMRELATLVVAEHHSRSHFPDAAGLSITFPDRTTWLNDYVGPSPSKYFLLDFCTSTVWTALLAAVNPAG